MQKLISNREMFRQLLARNILDILYDINAGNCVDLVTVREHLQHKDFNSALQHYYKLHTSKGWSYLCFDDRFYRAVQSINDKGYGISVRKHCNGKLYVFSTRSLRKDVWKQFVADNFKTWDTCYSNNTGYNINSERDEAEAMNVIDVA